MRNSNWAIFFIVFILVFFIVGKRNSYAQHVPPDSLVSSPSVAITPVEQTSLSPTIIPTPTLLPQKSVDMQPTPIASVSSPISSVGIITPDPITPTPTPEVTPISPTSTSTTHTTSSSMQQTISFPQKSSIRIQSITLPRKAEDPGIPKTIVTAKAKKDTVTNGVITFPKDFFEFPLRQKLYVIHTLSQQHITLLLTISLAFFLVGLFLTFWEKIELVVRTLEERIEQKRIIMVGRARTSAM